MRLTIHRGANQIGGSCVEVATDKTRIILDVGTPLDEMDTEFPTPLNVPGLFQKGSPVDAILISHSHLDHCGLLPIADQKVPVFLSKGADQALSVLRLFTGQDLLPNRRPNILIPGQKEAIGDIAVTPFAVDHSAPGCLAFLIESRGTTLLYSGDLRLHGRQTDLFETLQKAKKGKRIDLLLMEGTTLSPSRGKGMTEQQLENVIFEKISNAKGLVFGLFSPLHLDRLKSFLQAAKRSGRVFVPDLYAAYVMHMFQTEGIPSPARKSNIPVFFNRSCQQKIKRSKLCRDLEKNRIGSTELLSRPEKYVVSARLSTFDLDFAKVPPESTLIYSFWSGYLKQPEWESLRKCVEQARAHFVQCHTSGHIFPDDIQRFIEALQPDKLVPIHTTAAKAFQKLYPKTKLLEDGKTWEIDTTRTSIPKKERNMNTKRTTLITENGDLNVWVPYEKITWFSFLHASRAANSKHGGWNSKKYWAMSGLNLLTKSDDARRFIQTWTVNTLADEAKPDPRTADFKLAEREQSAQKSKRGRDDVPKLGSENRLNWELFRSIREKLVRKGRVTYELPLADESTGQLKADLVVFHPSGVVELIELKKSAANGDPDSPLMALTEAICYTLQIVRCWVALKTELSRYLPEITDLKCIHLVLAAPDYWSCYNPGGTSIDKGEVDKLRAIVKNVGLALHRYEAQLSKPELSLTIADVVDENSLKVSRFNFSDDSVPVESVVRK